MTEHSEELLACPWCEGETRLFTHRGYQMVAHHGAPHCPVVRASMTAAQWNTRSDTALTEALARVKVLEDALDPFALLAGDSVNMNDPLHKWFTVAQLAQARVARNKERGDA